jgi:pyruvate,water dikinase
MLTYSSKNQQLVSENRIGAKAANLDRLTRAGFRVPAWCAVTVDAFDLALPELIKTVDKEKIESELRQCVLIDRVQEEIFDTLKQTGISESPIAVRSSAVGEDSRDASFAGQLASYLFVPHEEIAQSIINVWASAFTPHALQYFSSKNIPLEAIKVAVILQDMVDADRAGVVFTMDPVNGNRRTCVISSVYGIGEGLVSGQINGDTFRVTPVQNSIDSYEIKPEIVKKMHAVGFDRDNGMYTHIKDVAGNLQTQPSLDHAQILEVNGVARDIAELFKGPQDIEWAYKDKQLYILQSRPITTIRQTADHSQVRRVWDNSNIAESYGGVTTPLTFTFVQDVYTEVYKQFCRILGVEQRSIELNADIFKMLGIQKGRIYYNLLNWYKALSLLPGYSINASFMEQMMGVSEKLKVPPSVIRSKRIPILQLTVSVVSLLKNLMILKWHINAFHRHFDVTISGCEQEIIRLKSLQELVDLFRKLEKSLLRKWQAPLLNDFYAMIFHGLLKKILNKWGIDDKGTLVNDLLCGEGGIISTEPITSLYRIALSIIKNTRWKELFSTSDDNEIVKLLGLKPQYSSVKIPSDVSELSQSIKEHLENYGDRCAGELKLETITPRMDPVQCISMLRNYIFQDIANPENNRKKEVAIRENAEKRVINFCKRSLVKKTIFKTVAAQTRLRVKDRENLRFERTRLFAVIRNIFCTMGTRLQEEGIIEDSRDVFYLTKDEIFAIVEGTSVLQNVKHYIAYRKKEFSDYATMEMPGRFETFGPPVAGNSIKATQQKTIEAFGEKLQGIGCCCGIVRAKVKVVHNPSCDLNSLKGCILVAERTDPGWTMIFPFASGILVERGSLLSHSAIVAREMGIPAIVNIPDLVSLLHDDMVVEMDGATGRISIISSEPIPAAG